MDVSSIASFSTAMSETQTRAAVQTSVLKKSIDIQEQSAMALIQGAMQVGQTVNPPNLGNRVDTFA